MSIWSDPICLAEENTELIGIRTGADGVTYDSAGSAVREQIGRTNAVVVRFGLADMLWEDGKTLSLEGLYASGTNRVASPTYVWAKAGTKIYVAEGYSIKYCAYSAVNFNAGINSFTLLSNSNFTAGSITLPSDAYYRFALARTGITVEDVPDAILLDAAGGYSVATEVLEDFTDAIDIRKAILLFWDAQREELEPQVVSKFATSDFVPVDPNNLYVIKFTAKTTEETTNLYTRVFAFDSDKTLISIIVRQLIADDTYVGGSIPLCIPENCKYIRFTYPYKIADVSISCSSAIDQTARLSANTARNNIETLQEEKFAVKRNNVGMVRQLVDIATSYHDRKNSGDAWLMHYGTNTPLSTTYQNDRAIDCSTFIGFVLRGIDFDSSPYREGAPVYPVNPFDPSQFVANPALAWSMNPAKYEYDLYEDVDYPQYAEARRASQLAEMMARQGREVPLDTHLANIQTGDILFFAKQNSDGEPTQPARYREISHVAIVIGTEDAPAGSTWDPTKYPYKHTYMDVSRGGNTDPTNIAVLEERATSPDVVGIGSLTCVMRPDLGAISTLSSYNSREPGIPGEMRFDSDYIYICTASGTWKRCPLEPVPPGPVEIVPWASGTDAQIAAMIDALDDGRITLAETGWQVGDERQVTLGAMAATGVGESHAAQTVTLVLMDSGHYELVAPTQAGRTTDHFVVGLKNALAEYGYMNSSDTNAGSWKDSKRRTWCNQVFKTAMPEYLRQRFKQFKVISATEYNASTVTTTEDFFALFAEKEIFNARTSGNTTEAAALTQIEYYTTASHRIKTRGESGSATNWWQRSPRGNANSAFCLATSSGSANAYYASSVLGLAPFGCI